jgi:hypothetical protein
MSSDFEQMHEARCTVSPWRGTSERLVDLARRATELMTKSDSAQDQVIRFDATVSYPGGRQSFANLQILQDRIGDIPLRQIASLKIEVTRLQTPHTITLTADEAGVVCRCEGREEAFVYGCRDVLCAAADANRVPEYKPEQEPIKWWQPIGSLIPILGIGGAVYWGATSSYMGTITWALLGMMMLGLLFVAAVPWESDRRIRNPPFELVTVEPQTEAEPTHRSGPVIRSQVWLRAHPLINLLLGVALGIAINKASELL